MVKSLTYLSLIASKKVKNNHILPTQLKRHLQLVKQCCLNPKKYDFVLACKYGHLECLKYCFKKVPTEATIIKMLRMVIQYHHIHLVEYLKLKGILQYLSHLEFFIVENNLFDWFKILLEMNGSVNQKTINLICDYNRVKFLPELYNNTIDINYKGLHNLIKHGHLRCFRYLMDNGVELYEECLIQAINFSPKKWSKQPQSEKQRISRYLTDILLEYDCPMSKSTLLLLKQAILCGLKLNCFNGSTLS